jgi:exopolysaccharide biosynthesis protein
MRSRSVKLGSARRVAATVAVVMIAGMGVSAASAAAPSPAQASGGSGAGWLPATPDQWPLVVDENTTAPQTITRGITHTMDSLDTVGGAQKAQVLNVDLSDPNVRLGVVESHDAIADPANETVSSMAKRTGAVAGVNADFFNIYGNGTPEGMVIRDGRLVKSPSPSWPADLGVRPDGSLVIGTQGYAGTLTDGTATHPLASVNTTDTLSGNGITRVTPDLGATSIPASTVVTGQTTANGTSLIVDSVATAVKSLPTLAAGTEDLVAAGTSGQWLASNVKAGDTMKVAETISPDNNLSQAVSGGAIIVHDGAIAVPAQGGGENNINNPVTGVGVSADGKHAIVAVFDGHQSEDAAEGLTRPQLAGWMIAHGAANAILFDSGGSSEMVGRLPGQAAASALNTPSDGHERPVANGLFFYSTEAHPGPATTAVVNNGQPLSILTGSTVPLSSYATDAAGNPAAGQPVVRVDPPHLAAVAPATLTAGGRKGDGQLLVQAGSAHSRVHLKVVDALSSLTLAPTQPNLINGGTQQFSDTATTRDGATVVLPTASAKWSVSPASLGTVDSGGLFTASATGYGLATVSATAGGITATASVAVGQTPVTVDPMTDPSKWAVHGTLGSTASLSESTTQKAQPADAGSMDVTYTIPGGNGVKQVVFSPTVNESFPAAGAAQDPQAVGLWVKGQGSSDNASTPLSLGNLTLAESYAQINGQSVNFYPSTVTYNGWRLIVAPLPAGMQFPLSVGFLDFLVINPAATMSGDLYVSDLQALYSPRPPAADTYTAIPDNPSWLQYQQDPGAFSKTGPTMLTGDDAHLVASDPGSAASNVMSSIATTLTTLPAQARPQLVQTLGDMSDDGNLADLQFAQTKIASLGLPYRDLVGNHEITQGALPETGNFNQVFGDTHYAYTLGTGASSAAVIATDSAHGGITESDPFQSPSAGQWPWLVQQLSDVTASSVMVLTHMPAYDPHPIADSQFSDRYEAQEYVRLIQRYQQTHPKQHVVMMYGHSRGFAEQILDPEGNPTSVAKGGVPQFTFADLGMPAYATPEQGGFYNYGLLHVTDSGDLQFAVQPVLASIAITTPQPTLAQGAQETITATGTNVGGDNLSTVTLPIADPASHLWSSSDPRVALIDPVTGTVTARKPGTTKITVESDGVTATTAVTVTG